MAMWSKHKPIKMRLSRDRGKMRRYGRQLNSGGRRMVPRSYTNTESVPTAKLKGEKGGAVKIP